MKVVTLLENTACTPELTAVHGLSLYIETPRHKILFDMGPDGAFLTNAQKLGVDLSAVDLAFLSHGHNDHGGGIRTFCDCNSQADILINSEAFGEYYAQGDSPEPEYIGLDSDLFELESRIIPTGDFLRLDEELALFSDVPNTFSAMSASARLKEKVDGILQPDAFRHEQNLLVTVGDKTVLFAGCAHRGIVNILQGAKAHIGRLPDVVFGGFHFFQLDPADPKSDQLLADTGTALLEGETIFYTGHCTGEYAYETLHAILGDRLGRMTGGAVVEL